MLINKVVSSNKEEIIKFHLWEEAGVGVSPFRVVGIASFPSTSLAEANPGAYQTALAALPKGYFLGTCAYCGRAITVNCLVQDANGKKFSIGSDCVKKSNDIKIFTETQVLQRNIRREKQAQKRKALLDEKLKVYEVALQEERNRNAGLTNSELRISLLETAKQQRIDSMRELSSIISRQVGNFAVSISSELNMGQLDFSLRVVEIMQKICDKQNSGLDVASILAEAKAESDIQENKANKINK